ncbi:MAG: hypothetical protein K6G69_05660 [Lachnospiraceae bacterium]|nr:hypothetical protein [Lachnospiraceae bacterium]
MSIKTLIRISDTFAYIIFFIIIEKLLGEQGLGLFGTGFLTYLIIFILTMGGVKELLAKMVAVRRHRGFYDNAKRIFNYCLGYSAVIGLLIFAIFVALGSKMSVRLYKDGSLGMVFWAFGLFYLIDSFVRTFRGYHNGCQSTGFMTAGRLTKSLILIVAGRFVIGLFMSIGSKAANLHQNDFLIIVYGCMGAVLTMCVADIIYLIILVTGQRAIHTENYSFNEVRSKDGFKSFLRSFIPGSLKLLKDNLFPVITAWVGVFIFCRSRFRGGASAADVYSQLGSFYIFCLSAVLVLAVYKEYISGCRSKMRSDIKKDDKKSLNSKFNNLLKNSFTIVFPISMSMIAFSKMIFTVTTGNTDKASLMITGAFAVLLYGIDLGLITSLEVKGLDLNALLGRLSGFIAALLFILLMDKKGVEITTVTVAIMLDALVNFIIQSVFIMREYGFRLNDITARLIKVCISSAVLLLIDFLIARFVKSNVIVLIVGVIIGYAVYSVSLVLLRTLNGKDIESLKGTVLYYPLNLLAGLLRIR